jgi:sulfotransferase famil protein
MISTDINALNAIAHGEPRDTIGATLITTVSYPLYYRPIPKCGSTFIYNLLYYLNYGYIYASPLNIHKTKQSPPSASNVSKQEIINSKFAFVIIRDPMKRFMSLYFNKLYPRPKGHRKASLGNYFENNGLIDRDIGNDIEKHCRNCIRSINWIKQNISGETDQKVNWHWKPQKIRLKQIHKLRFNVITLEDLNYQLPVILEPLIPHISDAMKEVSAQNVSQRPVRPEDVLNEELRKLIFDTYPDDTKIHKEVSTYWRNFKENH